VNKLSRYLKSYLMEITNKKSVYKHIYLMSNFIKIIGYYKHIYFNINHYEIKIGYYKNIYFFIILHENILGYYKHRYFFYHTLNYLINN
jgi:hypothetical protein